MPAERKEPVLRDQIEVGKPPVFLQRPRTLFPEREPRLAGFSPSYQLVQLFEHPLDRFRANPVDGDIFNE